MARVPALIERAAEAIYMARNGHGAQPFRTRPQAHREPYYHDAQACEPLFRAAEREACKAQLKGVPSFGDGKWAARILDAPHE